MHTQAFIRAATGTPASLPIDKPSMPGDKPSMPGDKPTGPSDKPTGPSDKPTGPSDKPTGPVIEVAHLRKAYGPTIAVEDVSFTIQAGEIFGIVGRNGAGKTTTVECMTGLRTPDRGAITVLVSTRAAIATSSMSAWGYSYSTARCRTG
jgi:ABC-type glutathione transport system ATPase component